MSHIAQSDAFMMAAVTRVLKPRLALVEWSQLQVGKGTILCCEEWYWYCPIFELGLRIA